MLNKALAYQPRDDKCFFFFFPGGVICKCIFLIRFIAGCFVRLNYLDFNFKFLLQTMKYFHSFPSCENKRSTKGCLK